MLKKLYDLFLDGLYALFVDGMLFAMVLGVLIYARLTEGPHQGGLFVAMLIVLVITGISHLLFAGDD